MAGANASANLYSLIETANATGIAVYAYLKMLFTELPKASTFEEIKALYRSLQQRTSVRRLSCGDPNARLSMMEQVFRDAL